VKRPGAPYTFFELCDIEATHMQDNAKGFDKKMLYQQINKVANSNRV